jgi:hypothetical protein
LALVRAAVSGEGTASFIGMKSIRELGTILTVISNFSTLRRNTNYMGKETIEWDIPHDY